MKDGALFDKQPDVFPRIQFELFRISNGLRSGALFAGEFRYDWRQDTDGRALLDKLTPHLKLASVWRGEPLVSEMLVSSYLGAAERKEGSGESDVLANLMRSYDDHVSMELFGNHGSPRLGRHTWQDVAKVLGKNTAMIAYAVSQMGGEIRVDSIIMSDGRFTATDQIVGRREDVYDFTLSGDDMRGHLDHFGSLTAEARVGILKDPPKQSVVSKEGRRGLDRLSRLFVGERVTHLLNELSMRGYRHLCIVPFGPLHFAPFHLFSLGSGLLADTWTVTYLPNAELLMRQRTFAQTPMNLIESFGVTFAGTGGFANIDEAGSEADKIAGIPRTIPMIGLAPGTISRRR